MASRKPITPSTLEKSNLADKQKYCRDVMGIDPKDIEEAVLAGKIKVHMEMTSGVSLENIEDLTKDEFDAIDTAVVILQPSSENHNRGKHKTRAEYFDFNGTQYFIPRGRPVRVPRGVVEIMHNTIGYEVDPETKMKVPRTYMPYTVVTPEAIAEYERTIAEQ